MKASYRARESAPDRDDSPEMLTPPEAAKMLGVSSPNTVKNWLESGSFPGSFKTKGGHWRIPRAEVEAMLRELQETRTRNLSGDLTPDEEEPGSEPPLL